MLRKTVILVWAVALCGMLASGCAKIGEVAGKVVKEVKEAPGEFREGYQKGRQG